MTILYAVYQSLIIGFYFLSENNEIENRLDVNRNRKSNRTSIKQYICIIIKNNNGKRRRSKIVFNVL